MPIPAQEGQWVYVCECRKKVVDLTSILRFLFVISPPNKGRFKVFWGGVLTINVQNT
jgi:hypothetical protein